MNKKLLKSLVFCGIIFAFFFLGSIARASTGNIWVANYASNNVTELSPNGSTIGTYSVGIEPDGIAIDSSGNVWVANSGSSNVTELNPNGSVIGTYSVGNGPVGIAIDSSGNVWVANDYDATVTELNSTGSVIGTYNVGGFPMGIAIDSSGNVWVANSSSSNVTELSPNGSVIGTYTVGFDPWGIAIDFTGNVWITNLPGNVTELNSNGSIIGTYSMGRNEPWSIAIDSSGNVWVANYGGSNVTELNPNGSVIGTYSVGIEPDGIAIDSSGNVWVANNGSNNVTELSSTGSVIGTYPVGSDPKGIAAKYIRSVSPLPVFNNVKIYDINGTQFTGNGDVQVDYPIQFKGTYTAGSDGTAQETTIWIIKETTAPDTTIYTTKVSSGDLTSVWIPRNTLAAATTYSITTQTANTNGLLSVPSSINFTTVSQSNTNDTIVNQNTGAQIPSDQVPTDTNIKTYFSGGTLPDTALMVNFKNTPVLVETSQGDTIVYLGQFTPGTPPPSGSAFDGVFTTKIECKPGATITVTYVFPQDLPAGTKWYKYIETNPVGQQWVEYPNAIILGNTVIVQLTDGGQGDQDGTANGIILDPSGPGIPYPTSLPVSSGGSGGVPVGPLAVFITGILVLIKTKQKKNI